MNGLDVLADPAFASRLCWTLLHSLWLVGGLSALAYAIDRLMARHSAAICYNVHALALALAIAVLPATFLWLGETARFAAAGPATAIVPSAATDRVATGPSETPTALPDATGPRPAIARAPQVDWAKFVTRGIVALYLVGVVLMIVRLAAGMWRSQRLVSGAHAIAGGPQWQMLARLASGWKMRYVPRLALARDLAMPCVTGLLRPTIVLPAAALGGLSAAELELILAHELAHVWRGDLWMHLLARLAEAVLFFNPGIWYLTRRLATLREFCCDELACSTAGDRRASRVAYAGALVRSAELSLKIDPQSAAWSEIAMLASGGRSASELRRRVARLLDEPLAEPAGVSRGTVLALAMALVVACVLPTVAYSESEAEKSEPQKSEVQKLDAKTRSGGGHSNSLPLEPEVVAIRVEGGGPWWDAQGKVLELAPDYRVTSRAGFPAGQHLEELFFKVPGLPKDASVRHEVKSGGWTSRDRVGGIDGQPLSEIVHVRFAISPEQKTFDLRVGIAAGEWKTVYTGDTNAQAEGTRDRKGVVQSGVFEQNGKSVVIVSHNWLEEDTRLVAVDRSGKTHVPASFSQIGAADHQVNQSTYEFANLRATEIEKFEFQIRNFKWTDLKNLPAQPLPKGGSKSVTLSGRIVPGKGMSAKTRGNLGATGSGGVSYKQFDSASTKDNEFTITAQPGSIWLKYFPEESAPIGIGPLEARAGETIDGLELTLVPGHAIGVRVTDRQARPIEGATVSVMPVSGRNFSGNARSRRTGPKGELQLEHLGLMPYDVTISAPGYQTQVMERMTLSPGEGQTFDFMFGVAGSRGTVTVNASEPKPKFKLAGRIYDPDGRPATTSGWLYYDFSEPSGNKTSGTGGQFADAFSVEVPESVVWLKYFPAGFAPLTIGPFDVRPETRFDDLRIELQRGIDAKASIVDGAGRPVPAAKLMALPELAGSTNGPALPLVADEHGIVELRHLADVPYTLTASAPGFQPRELKRSIGGGERFEIALTAARPARGVLRNDDGSPAAGAKLMLRVEAEPGRTNFGGDRLLATADEQGRFALDELRDGWWYLVQVQAADGARALLPPLQAGESIEFTIPRRQDLAIHIAGDLSQLPKRRGQHYVSVRQTVEFKPAEGVSSSDLLGDEVPVTPNSSGGGTAEYRGLLPDLPIAVQAGRLTENFDAGVEEVRLRLPE